MKEDAAAATTRGDNTIHASRPFFEMYFWLPPAIYFPQHTPMTSASSKALDSYPALGLLAVTRAALGCGIGMMVADKFQRPSTRQTRPSRCFGGRAGQRAVAGAFGAGAWSTGRNPSAAMKQRLASIRGSAGFERRRGNVLRRPRAGRRSRRAGPARPMRDDLPAVSPVFNLPALLLLLWLTRRRLRAAHWKCIAALCGIVFLATTPWDNWAVHRGFWTFDWSAGHAGDGPAGRGAMAACRRRNTLFS